jgi:hypothetical protein
VSEGQAIARLNAALLNLASELWVKTEQLDNLTAVLLDKGVIGQNDLTSTAIGLENDPGREVALRDYIERILTPLREPTAG